MDWPAWMTHASPGWAWRTGLGVDPGPVPHAGLGEPPGAVVVQLPVVLQGADHPGQGQQPLGVGALVDHDPAGTGGQQPGGLAVVAEAFDALGGDHDLDADVADPLGQVDGASRRPEARARELVQDQQGVLALAGLAAGGVVAVVLQHHPHGRIRLALGQQGGDGEDGQVDVLVATSGPRSKAPARAAKKSA